MTTTDAIVWLDTEEFAIRQCKGGSTIRRWCNSGFIVELGFLLRRDPKGYWQIGIPLQHQAYAQFAHSTPTFLTR